MKACGIVVEYNPFHNGHIHHIKQARRLSHCDVLIAIMSPNFVQRGEPAIASKWQRAQAALEHGVDLIIELPTIYATQSAQVFADHSIALLHQAQVSTVVFGSETNDLQSLQEIADLSIRVDYFKEQMKQGIGYPKAISLFTKEASPNDILAIAYLKALKDLPIEAITIQRTNDYHAQKLDRSVSSASAIRQGLVQGKTVSHTTPMSFEPPYPDWNMLYPYIRHQLLTYTPAQRQAIFMMDEGIDGLFAKHAEQYDDVQDFIQSCVSKRYSRSRIQRIMVHLLLNHQRARIQRIQQQRFRVLGFNQTGQQYLKQLKSSDVSYCTSFKHYDKDIRELEYQASAVYGACFDEKTKKRLLQQEVSQLLIYR